MKENLKKFVSFLEEEGLTKETGNEQGASYLYKTVALGGTYFGGKDDVYAAGVRVTLEWYGNTTDEVTERSMEISRIVGKVNKYLSRHKTLVAPRSYAGYHPGAEWFIVLDKDDHTALEGWYERRDAAIRQWELERHEFLSAKKRKEAAL